MDCLDDPQDENEAWAAYSEFIGKGKPPPYQPSWENIRARNQALADAGHIPQSAVDGEAA